MTPTTRSPLFSRLITLIAVLACLGAAGWAGMQFLEPVPVPPPIPPKAQVRFDPKADVSKNAMFQRLEQLGPAAVEAGMLGRVNPFVPVPPAAYVTPTAAVIQPGTVNLESGTSSESSVLSPQS